MAAHHNDDDYDIYSEDFQSEDGETHIRSAHDKQSSQMNRGKMKAARGKRRGFGGGRTSKARSDSNVDAVTKRLLSASRLKMNELHNQLEELRKQMKIVQDENKLYKRMQHKQEKKLEKYEDTESDLPQLIISHNNEVRSLREQLRRMKEKYDKSDRYLRDAEDELEDTKTKLKKYKALSEQKDLEERSDLNKRLQQADIDVEAKGSELKILQRHVEMLKKNHRHELGIERARHRDTQKQLDDLKENFEKLEAALREKERHLDAKNIYSHRLLKPASHNGTPADSPSASFRASLKKKSGSVSDLTPRDKAKAYEEKRKTEDKKKEKFKLPKVQITSRNTSTVSELPARAREVKQKWEMEEPEKETVEKGAGDIGTNLRFQTLEKEDSAEFWRRQEEKQRWDQDNRHKRDDKEQSRFQQQRQQIGQDMEERERAERERREADDRERREREDREKQREEKERRARIDRERREKLEKDEQERKEKRQLEERERKEKEERERRMREEQLRLDNDPDLQEQRRKKEELLRRLQQMDSQRDGSQPASNSDPFAPSDSTRTKGAAEDPFSRSAKNRPSKDPFSRPDSDSPSNKKDYTFTKPIENMHQGKPAREDVSIPYLERQKKARTAKEDAELGGYQPSFAPTKPAGSPHKKTTSLFDDDPPKPASKPPAGSQEKKSKLMTDLFGSQASSSKRDDSEAFFLTNRAQSKTTGEKKSSGFPWDSASSGTTKVNGTSQRESSTLFGGGAALVDDDVPAAGIGKSNLLPKRPRQPASTLSSKPTVVAVDNMDDDIEEVIL